jgi:hypothetical protein
MGMWRVLASVGAIAGMVPNLFGAPLAVEGRFEVIFCYGGEVKTIEHSKDVMGGAVFISGPVRSVTEGGVLDRSAASCRDAFTVVQGKLNEYGFCEIVDSDGDRMFFAFTSDMAGGKWTGYPGTGKYQGYLWQADWERLGPFPSVVQGMVQGCNRYWGTYKQSKATEFQAK